MITSANCSKFPLTAVAIKLTSDDSRRDGAIRRQALETGAFPDASFVLTAPVDLGSVPVAGASFTAEATGDLTIHGVARNVTVPINWPSSGSYVKWRASPFPYWTVSSRPFR